MTYKVHAYKDGKRSFVRRMAHLPRLGESVRLDENTYAKVTEVVWCIDEDDREGQRVNIGLETEK